MTGRYAAFTFCDRITRHVPAQRAEAHFAIPGTLDSFASCLVAEATGQLAAWVAMAHVGFRSRPVAALANETRYLRDVRPGETLELAVDLEQCDEETVAYSGRASVAGTAVVELVDCVAPMLPQDEYDSAEDLARQFALLCGEGAAPGRFGGVPAHALETVEDVPGTLRRALLRVPVAAPFFADHFPRRPVYPATLMLDAALAVAQAFVAGTGNAGTTWRPARVTHVKMRDWTLPGQTVDIGVTPLAATATGPRVAITARIGERTVATARAEFTAKAAS
jgi:3-hydroxymyristoyl/3-hydroxydecanoyl-(acyl carrier protein) dehydratase